ncbi:MAG: LysM peptidoglycan-binding domain-containing protein, partial [Bacteroidia bacterium]
ADGIPPMRGNEALTEGEASTEELKNKEEEKNTEEVVGAKEEEVKPVVEDNTEETLVISSNPITPIVQPETVTTSPSVVEPTILTPPPAETLSVWINYVVQPGESLWGIATKFGTKVEIVKKSNNITNEVLSPGQILKIYAKSSKSNQPNATPIPAVQTISYTVQKGDNLNKISQKYGTTLEAIMKQNNLGSSTIKEGQILSITVKNGE